MKMLINRRFAHALVLVTVLMVSACGFQLRGSNGQSNLPFKTIYLGVSDASPLGNDLKRYIAGAGGTTIVSDPKAAEAVVEILSETRNKIILSLNSQGRIREYTLSYTLAFQVKDGKNNLLLAPTDIPLRRVISFNESQVLAKESEEAALYRDMQSDMVQQILRRLAAIKPAAAS
jgi:LPS-assembly lipoprotein